jgi:archaellum component FlaC
MDFLKDWLGLGISMMAFGTAAWSLLQGPARKNEKALDDFKTAMTTALEGFKKGAGEQIAKLDERLNKAEANIGKIDTVIGQMPSKDEFHSLDKGLTEVRGKIDTISVTVGSAEHALQRIEGFLINAATAQAKREH